MADLHLNSACNLESFATPAVRDAIREVFPHEVDRRGPLFPAGFEYRKDWEVAMAVLALRAGGVFRPDAEVLGVGAGNEPTIFFLTNHVRRVFATDLYLGNEEWDESAHASMLHNPGLHWIGQWEPRRLVVQHMDALDLRYEDDSFDAVFSSSSIEHFGTFEDVHRAVSEIHRVLKPGGVLSLSTELRLGGPGPGIPGVLMFDPQQVHDLFIEPFDFVLLDDLDLDVTAATLGTQQLFGDLLADLRVHLESRPFIRFDELDWSRYPHIVLRDGERTWTSFHLALRKPALTDSNG